MRYAKLSKPGPHQFADECHFSRTGYAIWEQPLVGVAFCTCRPCKKHECADGVGVSVEVGE